MRLNFETFLTCKEQLKVKMRFFFWIFAKLSDTNTNCCRNLGHFDVLLSYSTPILIMRCAFQVNTSYVITQTFCTNISLIVFLLKMKFDCVRPETNNWWIDFCRGQVIISYEIYIYLLQPELIASIRFTICIAFTEIISYMCNQIHEQGSHNISNM